jgi:hypothetical protein
VAPGEPAANLSRRGFFVAGAGSLALRILDCACDSLAAPIKFGSHHIPPDSHHNGA